MMKKYVLLISMILCIVGCEKMTRERKVDKSYLTGMDYRLFQDTPAWELAKAVQDEDAEKIKQIVDKNPKLINYQEPIYGGTLLMLTIRNQQMKSFRLLLEHKADINIYDTFSGTSAIINSCGSIECGIKYVQILIQKGANVNDIEIGRRKKDNSTRFTPLIAASGFGRLDIVKLLVSNKADINYMNEFDQTAFSESVMTESYNVSIFLLQHGADYKRPVFYRPDYSIPSENRDPKDKGKPMYIVDVLREDFFELGTDKYEYKMEIVDFLKSKGINYRAAPIPDYIKKKAQEYYPTTWREYLKEY